MEQPVIAAFRNPVEIQEDTGRESRCGKHLEHRHVAGDIDDITGKVVEKDRRKTADGPDQSQSGDLLPVVDDGIDDLQVGHDKDHVRYLLADKSGGDDDR